MFIIFLLSIFSIIEHIPAKCKYRNACGSPKNQQEKRRKKSTKKLENSIDFFHILPYNVFVAETKERKCLQIGDK